MHRPRESEAAESTFPTKPHMPHSLISHSRRKHHHQSKLASHNSHRPLIHKATTDSTTTTTTNAKQAKTQASLPLPTHNTSKQAKHHCLNKPNHPQRVVKEKRSKGVGEDDEAKTTNDDPEPATTTRTKLGQQEPGRIGATKGTLESTTTTTRPASPHDHPTAIPNPTKPGNPFCMPPFSIGIIENLPPHRTLFSPLPLYRMQYVICHFLPFPIILLPFLSFYPSSHFFRHVKILKCPYKPSSAHSRS